MIRIARLRDRDLVQGDIELLGDWSEDLDETIWIDIAAPTRLDIEPLLEEWFRFHELAAEDALSENTLPKYDSFATYDFFVFRSVRFDVSNHGVETTKIAVFMGKNFLFTIHAEPLDSIDNVWNRLPMDRRLLQRGADFVLYSILDQIVDAHFPFLDEIENKMDSIHEEIFTRPNQGLMDELLHLKRDLNVLRRQSLPQRELFNAISRGDTRFVKNEHLIYYRDLYDHMFRIGESIDVERDLATGTMDAYLSVIANRTNEIMKVLTIFSSILLPMNFIAGIYGMNFVHMPELGWKYGYVFAFGLMGVVMIVMLAWFWQNGWLGERKKPFAGLHLRRRRHPPSLD
jgi:magnesium transporter